jgi:peptidoglycan/LPS O-acetylase OafA/YrhL
MSATTSTDRRIPSLDGLRAISIALVLLAHLDGTQGFPSMPFLARMGNVGFFGVRVFFVISGFLITTLLVNEARTTGRISLKLFYFRRLMRIFPASYVFLACMGGAAAIGWITLRPWDLLAGFAYLTNYHPDRAWFTGHLWSLSVEEQFYLLWPGVLALAGVRKGLLVAAAVILGAPAVRVFTVLFLPVSERLAIGESFQTVCDALAMGCLLAGYRGELAAIPRYLGFLRSRGFWLVPAGVVAAFILSRSAKFGYPIGETLMNAGIALCIDRFVRYPDGVVGRCLNTRPMIFVGNLSYSLYLWQQPFLNRNVASLWTSFPLNLTLAFACAMASYYLVEKPCLRWRGRLERRWRGRAAMASVSTPALPGSRPGR